MNNQQKLNEYYKKMVVEQINLTLHWQQIRSKTRSTQSSPTAISNEICTGQATGVAQVQSHKSFSKKTLINLLTPDTIKKQCIWSS